MIRRLLPVLLVGLGGVLAGSTRADDSAPKLTTVLPPVYQPSLEGCVSSVEKVLPHLRIYLVEEQAAVTIPRLTPRAVEVARDRRAYLEVDMQEVPYCVTELELKPREIVQEVVVCEIQPEQAIDPATGKPCTHFKQVHSTKRVKVTVYDLVPVEKRYLLKTPYLKTKEEDVIVKHLVLDATTEAGIDKRLRAITVPQEIKVQVPICPLPCLHTLLDQPHP